jgi:hypothetical protein
MREPNYLGLSSYPRMHHRYQRHHHGWGWLMLALAVTAAAAGWLAVSHGEWEALIRGLPLR